MIRRHFRTRAELERQMAAARQLRSETLAGGVRFLCALAGAYVALHLKLLRVAAPRPRNAWFRSPADTTSGGGFGS